MLDLLQRNRKKKVILDTNFLLLPGSKAVDVFSEIEHALSESFSFYVIDKTYDELQNLTTSAKKGADKFNAKLGFILGKQKGLKTLRSSQKVVDDAIVAHTDGSTYVATLDKDLQKRVREAGGKILTLRGLKVVIRE